MKMHFYTNTQHYLQHRYRLYTQHQLCREDLQTWPKLGRWQHPARRKCSSSTPTPRNQGHEGLNHSFSIQTDSHIRAQSYNTRTGDKQVPQLHTQTQGVYLPTSNIIPKKFKKIQRTCWIDSHIEIINYYFQKTKRWITQRGKQPGVIQLPINTTNINQKNWANKPQTHICKNITWPPYYLAAIHHLHLTSLPSFYK